jgi:hypothetical protein
LAFAKEEQKLGIVGVKLTALVISFLKVNGEFNTFVAFTKMAGLYKIFPKKLFGQYYITQDQKGEVAILVGAFMFMEEHCMWN